MTTSNSNPEALVFRGPPGHLLLHSDLPAVSGLSFKPDETLQSTIGNSKSSFRIQADRSGTLKRLKVRLSNATKPGLYHATLETSDGSIPVDINVEPRSRLVIAPVELALSGAPGDKVQSRLLFSNKGNVTLAIPESDTLGIYDDDGIETAFASTYRMESDDLSKLFANFAAKLRDGHGGLLKLRLLEGSGKLEPGTSRSVLIEAQLPSKLKPGHNYHGVWSLLTAEHAVTVAVNK